ncbi:unnamed protein product [Orchesella dallaii]|uniref:Gustatory receptor n=1 Tax=Orchesella dallaii TaxID=48710 RepID=A0ABP1S8S0_9HEXA
MYAFLIFQIACGVCHCLAIYGYAISIRHAIDEMSNGISPVKYFSLLVTLFSLLYKVSIVNCIWKKQDILLKIVNFPSPRNPINFECKSGSSIIESYICVRIICTVAFLASITRLCIPSTASSLQAEKSDTDSFQDWYWSLVSESRYVFFLSTDHEQQFEPRIFSHFHCILAGFTLLSLLTKFIMGVFVDIFLLMNVLTLWARVREFVDVILKEEQVTSPASILAVYWSLQKFATLINDYVGVIFVYHMGEDLLAYAITLKDFLSFEISVTAVLHLFYYGCSMSILFVPSIICHKVRLQIY